MFLQLLLIVWLVQCNHFTIQPLLLVTGVHELTEEVHQGRLSLLSSGLTQLFEVQFAETLEFLSLLEVLLDLFAWGFGEDMHTFLKCVAVDVALLEYPFQKPHSFVDSVVVAH